ncbi:MAG: molybdopterin molybdotransferase MoeA, partial [Pseudomonadota bacterium]
MTDKMLSVEQAVTNITACAQALKDVDTIALEDALGRTLAAAIHSPIDVPAADNSAMDGYALNVDDLAQGEAKTKLPVMQIITAGADAAALTRNTAARIFTGADIPQGANAVVMQEQCDIYEGSVCVPNDTPVGNNIRPRGQDICTGEKIFDKGRVLKPQDLGLLAAIGHSHIKVIRPLSVAIISTGNELVNPGTALKPGQIYNSNRYLLIGLLNKL